MAGRLLLGQTHEKLGRLPEATIEYLEALKFADSLVVPNNKWMSFSSSMNLD